MIYQPHDVIDDSFGHERMSLLHRNTRDLAKEGNHFDILCLLDLPSTSAAMPQVLPTHSITTTTTTTTPLQDHTTTQPATPDNITHDPQPQHHHDAYVVPSIQRQGDHDTPHQSQTSTHDAAINTDPLVTMPLEQQDRREIPVLVPISLPPGYNHMPPMWRYIPPTCHNLWTRLCAQHLHAAWLADCKNDVEKKDTEFINLLLLPRQVLLRTPGQRSARYKLKKRLRH